MSQNKLATKIGIAWLVSICVVVSVLIVGGCEPRKPQFIAEFDRTNSPMLVTFVIYDSQYDLQKALADQLDVKRIEGKAYGFAQWYKNEKDINVCVLHLLKPKSIDDEITLTWGHELAHCAYGTYHKETVGR